MVKFFTISSVREAIKNYNKINIYTNCESDLCIFFRDKSIDTIFNQPILLAPSNKCRFIKSRVVNSLLNTGKSGSYRLYYYVDIEESRVYLLGYYPKTGKFGRSDLTPTEEKIAINKFKSEKKNKTLLEHDISKGFKEMAN